MQVIYEFLKSHRIHFNKGTVRDYLSTHPYFPGILSISDLLDELKTDNAVLKISDDRFNDLPLPFIAQTSSVDGTFVLVKKIQNNTITYLNEAGLWTTQSLSEFSYLYSGIALVAEADAMSGEADFLSTRKKILTFQTFRIIQILTVIILLTAAYFYNQSPRLNITVIIFCMKIIGLILSVLLLVQMYGGSISWIDKFCIDVKGNNCKNVLLSAGATIFKESISWAEIGFFYFATSVMAMILYPPGTGLTLLICLSFLCIPFTFYSVWYQWQKVKSWCKLCLMIQAVLWIEIVAGISALQNFHPIILLKDIYILVAIGLILISLWFLIKPYMLNSGKVKELLRISNLFKKDSFIFNTLLQNQEKVDMSCTSPLTLGNPDAKFAITIVTNPLCQPCLIVQREALQLLEQYPNSVKISIILKPSVTQNQETEKIIIQLVEAYLEFDQQKFRDTIKRWGSSKSGLSNLSAMLKETSTSLDKVEEIVRSQRNWCEKYSITKTPTIFINGYGALPGYELKDLKHFIKEEDKPE